MKKLIQLLNLYQEERKSKFKFSSYDHNSSAFIIEKSPKMVLGEETIISKKFGFIQWLVENNKIKRKIKLVIKYFRCNDYGELRDEDRYNEVESLLMRLAISDDPIEFLVSLLR